MESIYDPNYYYSFAVDLTNRCNGKCIFCPRHGFATNVDKRGELELTTFKRLFNKQYIDHIHNLVINGNLGEPTFYSKMFELLEYVKHANENVRILISTNGSIRPTWWWRELAKRMTFNERNVIRFTLDGLSDTHHLYRGTNYETVFRNLVTYLDAGGKADWQFIVFKHNEHQLYEAKEIARDIGCSAFVTVVSRRYSEGVLERPTILDAKTKVELCSESSSQKLFCTPIENRHLFVSHEGFVYPCCDYALFKDFRRIEEYPAKLYLEYLRSTKQLDMSQSTLSEALNSRFFKYVIENRKNLLGVRKAVK